MWGVVVGDSSATSQSPRSSGRSYKSSRRGTASTYTSSLLEVLAAEYRDALVLGFFEEVARDYGAVLERVNAKFGAGFSSFVRSRTTSNASSTV
jgi:hypothetical protein